MPTKRRVFVGFSAANGVCKLPEPTLGAAVNGSPAKLEPFFQPCYNTAEPDGEDCS